jgi:iron(III) transport system permease protein
MKCDLICKQNLKQFPSLLLTQQSLTGLLCLFFVVPLLALFVISFADDSGLFQHFWDTVLTDYIINSIQLVVLVLIFSAIFALPSAWLTAMCEFRFRSYFQWMLMLPLALPAYVVAYIYTDLLDFAGPVQVFLRTFAETVGWEGRIYFDIRNVVGASLMLALVLYPYLYLIARNAFLEQGAYLAEVSRTLGRSPINSFINISLPLCRPAIVVGFLLIGAESLGDFATVNFFAVNTLTTAVYDSWLGHGSLSAAAKISLFLLLSVIAVLSLERWQARKKQVYTSYNTNVARYQLSSKWTLAALVWCGGLFLLSFIIPMYVIVSYIVTYFDVSWNSALWTVLLQTLYLAAIVATISCVLAVFFIFLSQSTQRNFFIQPLTVTSFNYMVPSTVLAVAVLIPTTFFELRVNEVLEYFSIQPPGLFLSGTVAIMVIAFVLRFQAIANGAVKASFANISPSISDAARSLGRTRLQTLFHVQIPLLKHGIMAAFLLVMIECLKELPAALLLRPFNFDTLATYVYQYVSDEQMEHAAIAVLLIILAGLVPVARLTRNS